MEVLTTKEAAKYLKVSVRTLLNSIKKNNIPHLKIGREYRFQKNVLEKMLNNN